MLRYNTSRHRRLGFTLVELLVVIAIIGILIALLLPAVQAAREAARRSQCSNNMKQMGLGFHNYHDVYKAFPLPAIVTLMSPAGATLGTTSSWGYSILPYVEQGPVYDGYNMNLSAWDPANAVYVGTQIPGYLCPTTPRTGTGITYTIPAGQFLLPTTPEVSFTNAAPIDYIATTGVFGSFLQIAENDPTIVAGLKVQGWGIGHVAMSDGTTFPGTQTEGCRIRDITDGSSNTILLAELAGRNTLYRGKIAIDPTLDVEAGFLALVGGGAWADPFNGSWELTGRLYDGTGSAGPCAINCSNARGYPPDAYGRAAGLYSFHPGGAQIALCDGSVTFLSETTANNVISALITRSRGEIVGPF